MNLSLAVLVIFTLLLAWSLLSPRGGELDATLFTAVNSRRLPLPAEIAVRLISHFGLLPTNVLIWAAVWYVVDRRSSAGVGAGIVGGAGLVVTWAVCRVLKAATDRPRPYEAIAGARLVGLAPSNSSFPSSHAAMAVYTAVTASHLLGFSTAQTLGAYVLAACVCYARIYLGAHYPRDVLAGIVIGLAAGMGTLALAARAGLAEPTERADT